MTTTLLSVLRAGDHLLASDVLYGGTHDFLTHHAEDLAGGTPCRRAPAGDLGRRGHPADPGVLWPRRSPTR